MKSITLKQFLSEIDPYHSLIPEHSTEREYQYRKWIVGTENVRFAVVIPDHYSNSLPSYLAMYAIVLKEFPEAYDLDLGSPVCSTVDASDSYKGMPVLQAKIKTRKLWPDGWRVCEKLDDVSYLR